MCPSRGRRAQPSSGASRSPPFPLHFPLLLVLIFSLLLPPASAAVATSDLLAYVGGTATGQSLTTLAYTLTMVANETAVLVSCSFDGKASEVGWLGWGVGSAMTDSDIIVLWPTVSGGSLTWTLSHRTASTTAMPTLVGSTSDDPSVDSTGNLKIVPGLSSASGDESPAVVTFERLLSLPDGYEGGKNYQLEASINQGVIYAYGDKNPGDSAQGTDFDQHSLDSMGASYVDLSSSFTADTAAIDAPLTPVKSSGGSSSGASKSSGAGAGGSTGTGSGGGASGTAAAGGASGTGTAAGSSGTGSAGSSSSSTGGTGSSSSSSSEAKKSSFTYAGVILIHGLCAGTACPDSSDLAETEKVETNPSFPVYLITFVAHSRDRTGRQTWIVSPLTFVALGLALWAVSLKSSASTETYTHRTIGFFFIGALVVQDLLGIFKHMGGPPRPGAGVSILGVCHIILGVTLTAVGFYQVHLGIVRYGGSDLVTYGLYGQTLRTPTAPSSFPSAPKKASTSSSPPAAFCASSSQVPVPTTVPTTVAKLRRR
ncbi:hypothetical protein JCM11641_000866 [Rhodosporidiobolus odoratus]